MKRFELLIGSLLQKLHSLFARYVSYKALTECAEYGNNCSIGYPCLIKGYNKDTGIKYIHLGDEVRLGANVTIFATRAHLYIGKKSFSGPNLTIMAGDHPFDLIGSYIIDNRKASLERKGIDLTKYDDDVVIEDDVWMGCNVTILKGVHIGRGSIVSAGSVVTKSFPPYSIIGGVPAKLIKSRWNSDGDKQEHERILYN